MNYAKIKHLDIANGEDIRTSLYVSGCNFHCKDCFNPETWDFKYGNLYTEDTEKEILNTLNEHVSGLSLLGGDPLWQDLDGIQKLIDLCKKVKEKNKNIWIWSGFTWEEIFSKDKQEEIDIKRRELISICDIWVDGKFECEKRDLNLKWRGSSNQRVIDIKKTLSLNKIVSYI